MGPSGSSKRTYTQRSVEFAAGCHRVQMTPHSDGWDRVILSFKECKLTAGCIDFVPFATQRFHLISKPVSSQFILRTGAQTGQTAGRRQTVLGC